MSAGGVFAIGGIWRPTAEWGQTYAMVMVDSSPVMAEAHDRMPVILRPEQWGIWLQGAPEEAFALVRTWPGGLSSSGPATAGPGDSGFRSRPRAPRLPPRPTSTLHGPILRSLRASDAGRKVAEIRHFLAVWVITSQCDGKRRSTQLTQPVERAARAVLHRFCLWRPCRAPERRKPIRSTVPQGASVEVFGAGQACSRHQTAYREAILFPLNL
jgi:hypothetical protein